MAQRKTFFSQMFINKPKEVVLPMPPVPAGGTAVKMVGSDGSPYLKYPNDETEPNPADFGAVGIPKILSTVPKLKPIELKVSPNSITFNPMTGLQGTRFYASSYKVDIVNRNSFKAVYKILSEPSALVAVDHATGFIDGYGTAVVKVFSMYQFPNKPVGGFETLYVYLGLREFENDGDDSKESAANMMKHNYARESLKVVFD